MVNFLNVYGPGLAILFVVFVEAAGVFWFYGVDRFSADVESMLGEKPGLFWRICWLYISPVFLLVIFIFSLLGYEEMLGGEYEYPEWSIALGWALTLSSILCIPIYIIYKILITPGNFKHVSIFSCPLELVATKRLIRFAFFQRMIKSFKPETSPPTTIPGQIVCSGTSV